MRARRETPGLPPPCRGSRRCRTGRSPPLKTLVAMTIGFAMAAVGMDTVSGELRLTFDQ
ncbi:hypothetical protein GH880_30430, partial [Bacillus thuringiensis]|nr:hypothetical protein [Bacillus thuringiensis]